MTIRGELGLRSGTFNVSAELNALRSAFDDDEIAYLLGDAAARVADKFRLTYPRATGAPRPAGYVWPDGRRSKFPSLAAQRGFFAALRAGQIAIPYRRTGRLGESLEIELTPTREGGASGVLITVSIDEKRAPYARWVIGDPQSIYFERVTFWEPLQELLNMKEQELAIQQAISAELDATFRGLGIIR